MNGNAALRNLNCPRSSHLANLPKKLWLQATSSSHFPYLVSLPDEFVAVAGASGYGFLIHMKGKAEKPFARPDRF